MCIIAICQERALTAGELDACWQGNSDGAGVAWVTNGAVHYVKGLMDNAELQKEYEKVRKNLPHIVHFRLASAGSVCPELTHPFVVTKSLGVNPLYYQGKQAILFQNGHVHHWEELLINVHLAADQHIKGEWSDGRLAAVLAARLGKDILSKLGGKFAVFSLSGIILWGEFHEERGVLFSSRPFTYLQNDCFWRYRSYRERRYK